MSQIGKFFAHGLNPITTITGNAGGPVNPDGAGNFNIVGTDPITVTGNPVTHTETITAATATTLQIGVTTLATNAETIAGVVNSKAIVPSGLAAKLGAQTLNTIPYGAGTAAAFNWLPLGTQFQVLQSGGAGVPAWSTATYPATTAQGDIIYSSALNTVDALAKNATATRYLSNTGALNNPAWAQVDVTNGITGIVPAADGGTGISSPAIHTLPVAQGAAAFNFLGPLTDGQLLIGSTGNDPVAASLTAGAGITITPGAGTITIAAHASFAWTVETVNMNMVVNHGYIANKVGTLELTLPAVSAVGDTVRVAGMNTALGWQIKQNAGNTIYFNGATTTPGAGGTLTSSAIHDAVELICRTVNADWQVISNEGNPTPA